MKSLILVGLLATVSLTSQAQTDTGSAPTASISALVNVLMNANESTTTEQLEANLLAAINDVCNNCTDEQVDAMINEATAAVGADSPLVANLLSALSDAGIDSDVVTLAAIGAGVDAQVASQATAAGPTTGSPSGTSAPIVSYNPPSAPSAPSGAGGSGGDSGISEIVN